MLSIHRRRGQAIVIGEDIVVHIESVRENCVEVRIDAPRSIPIERAEGFGARGEEVMLSIHRRRGQAIVIGEDIVVHIESVRENRVEVRIDAPRSIPIERKEVKDGLVPRRRIKPLEKPIAPGKEHA